MNNIHASHRVTRLVCQLLWVVLVGWVGVSSAQVCVQVKIEIAQQLTIERQAFVARLGISNGVSAPITSLDVDLDFKDAEGNPVVATTSPDQSNAIFFFREDEQLNVTGGSSGNGQVAGAMEASLTWLIVPTSIAGGNLPQGKIYSIGATINYVQDGLAKSITVVPDTIVVAPQPKLRIEYFLPRSVYGDEPLTPTVAETPEPFTLGVRIKNVGFGQALGARIDSAQPRITENTQGLLVNFSLLSSFVGNQQAQPTLLMDFGAIDAAQTKVGRWQMTASLSGDFVDFTADYTHSDSTGGALTSLIDTVSAKSLLKDVLIDTPGRDAIPDFLALDGDTLRTYDSESLEAVVIDRSGNSFITLNPDRTYKLEMPASSVPSYARFPDPNRGEISIQRVNRTNGSQLSELNAWLSKKRIGTGPTFEHFINVYDARGSGVYTLTVNRFDLGALNGVVYRDVNQNGIMDPFELGINRAAVTLSGTDIIGQTINTTVFTNAQGGYEFTQLFVGDYVLAVADMPGLVNGNHALGLAGGTVVGNGITGIRLGRNQVGSGYLMAKVSTSTTPHADLQPVATTITPSVAVGATVNVTVIARNNGPDSADGAITLNAPLGVIIDSATPLTGTYDSTNRRWTFPTIGAGAETNLQVKLRLMQPGTRTLRATLLPNLADPVAENNIGVLNISAGGIAGDRVFANSFEAIEAIKYLPGMVKEPALRVVEPAYSAALFSGFGFEDRLFSDGLESEPVQGDLQR